MNTINPLEDWLSVMGFMPADMDRVAKSSGAVERWRNIKCAGDLLRLILVYVAQDLSLRSAAGWSTATGTAEMADTSVLHRLRCSVPFLEIVLAHLLQQRMHSEIEAGPPLRLNDASTLSAPGSSGVDWRIHAVYDPASGRLVRVEVTDAHGGETLSRQRWEPGEVVIADRGLARADGIRAVHDAGAYSLLRMHWQNIRLQDERGRPLSLEKVLERAEAGITGTKVLVPVKKGPATPARLIVVRNSDAAAEKQRAALIRNAAKKRRTPSPLAMKLTDWFWVLTTIPEKAASDTLVTELYRIRWQIELFFKRLKSILNLDVLRAYDPDLAKAYILGKLILAALVFLLTSECEAFSPWGIPRRRTPASALVAEHANDLSNLGFDNFRRGGCRPELGGGPQGG